ncbi:hypothetical protein [Globicatella sanguinis]
MTQFETTQLCGGWTYEAEIIRFSTSGQLPTVRGWPTKRKLFNFVLLVNSQH